MKESSMPKADFLVSIFFIILGAIVLILSFRMPRFEDLGANPYSVPGIVPGFLGAIIAILGGALFARSILRKGYKLGLNREKVKGFLREQSSRNILLTILLNIIYAFFMFGRIPFELATVIYVFAFVAIFEYKFRESFVSQRRTVLFALFTGILVSGAVSVIFKNIFFVGLP
jgi:putative tricarboxylic transport membrane protein